jgi:hypothetical protein
MMLRSSRGVKLSLTVLAAVLTVSSMLALPACGERDASATAGHGTHQAQARGNPVVARGHSPRGIPWRIRAKLQGKHTITVDFGDWFTQFHYPDNSYVLTADTGAIGRYQEEDLDGVTARRVSKLVVKMSRGGALRIHPSLAPRRVRSRFPFLNGLRFFNRFYFGQRRPRWITAFDGHGRVLAHTHTHRGLFGCCGVKPPP